MQPEHQLPPAAVQVFVLLALGSSIVWVWCIAKLFQRRELLPYEPRRRAPWNGLALVGVVVLAILLQSIAAIATSDALGRAGFFLPASYRFAIQTLAGSLANLVAAAGMALWLLQEGALPADLGFRWGFARRDIAIGLTALLAALLPVLALHIVINLLQPAQHDIIKKIADAKPADRLTLLALVSIPATLIAPLVEEFFFRVLLQGYLESCERRFRQVRPNWRRLPSGAMPIVCSSVAFAAAHTVDHAPLFLLALILGYVYRQTHRFLPIFVVHAGLNTLTISLLWLHALSA